MTPRSTEPRRDGSTSRRGSSRATGEDAGRSTGLGGIADARAYTPRGRTVREAAELRRNPRPARDTDPFRPALHVLDGGEPAPSRSGRRDPRQRAAQPARPPADEPRVSGRPGRSRDNAASVLPPRRRPDDARPTAASRGRGPAPAGRKPPRPPRGPRTPRPPRLADPRRRLRLATLLTLALFAVIGIRLIALQLVTTPAYADGGLQDRLSPPVVLPAARGSIYDRNEAVLAHSVEARYVYADPESVKDPGRAATLLSPLLGIPRSDLIKRLVKQKRPDGRWSQFEFLARGVDIDVAHKILELELPGIGIDRDERREAPGHDLAANLIGFVGQDMNGLEGLEARYDDVLRGINGEKVFEIGQGDLATEIPGGYSRVTEPKPGSSLVLTIDRDLQYEVQRILSQAMKQRKAKTAAAIVLDPRSGEVLAQASYPTYDAADPLKFDPVDREDAATSYVVDPGSVHKALIFAAALEEGLIKPDSTVTIGPAIRKGDTVFADTHHVDPGTRMTLPGLMAYSSNVGTIKIGALLGPQRIYDYQRRFGLGERTGVGVLGEASGRLLPPKEWSGSAYGSVPIGHSVDVTPLQMAAAFGAIANDGVWVQPHLIKEIVDHNGRSSSTPAPKTRQVISASSAAATRTIMEAVTTVPNATGLSAAIEGYRIAGKTGTGKRIVNGRYTSEEVASFIGMAPADNPRYVIAVFAHTPNGTGGAVAAPAFREMMAYTLRHYRVPPSGSKAPAFVVHR
ncbi:peptidoglycan synthetase FtsI [Micromonospora pattaloongensis]|uniref:Peptidoglycan synthetase FtsI n=1 Tax=Micromonospora pattaloongensis TaxID=405436 RepID=A0A1H3Q4F7_9ACTN|nr:penicillin-binding protein 2 [Micromonospora pattaloongensis]SDZ07619.1 peptidoglycan synthetase FtsI [Micromonospora pattaloongensis]